MADEEHCHNMLGQISGNVKDIAVIQQSLKDHIMFCEKNSKSIHNRINFVITLIMLILVAIVGQWVMH